MLSSSGPAPASAQRFKLEPQNRIHAGLSMTNSSFDLGVSAGFDTRLSQALYVDIGGFATPADDAGRPELSGIDDASQYFELRHGVCGRVHPIKRVLQAIVRCQAHVGVTRQL